MTCHPRLPRPGKWLQLVAANGHGAHSPEPVSHAQRFEELMMMGLRLAEPIPFARIETETGRNLYDWVPEQTIEKLVRGNLLKLDDAAIATTQEGRQRLNSVLAYLMAQMALL